MAKKISRDGGGFSPVLTGVDASRLIAELREEIQGLLRPSLPTITLAEIAGRWLPRKLKRLKSADSFEGRVRLHLVPQLGHHSCATMKVRDVEDFLQGLLDSGLGPQTVNHTRDAGRQLVKDAIANGEWVGQNPFAVVPKLPVPDPAFDVLTRDEAARFLRWGLEPKWRPLFALALYLGPRRGTIFAIKKVDVDLTGSLIDFLVTKTGKPLMGVPIPDELRPYLERAIASSSSELLFSRSNGLPLSPKSHVLNTALAKGLERAEVLRRGRPPKITFHGLRRVSSCLLQEAGVHPWVVSKILGHSQSSLAFVGNPLENMTARRYTQFSAEFVRNQLNLLSLKSP